jgi:UDP-N-acetylglucosamine 2-epimerase (non-hydrolysing)/GDP/UDP-N,N'-diacetylbacillosamine 2-epimerase (hydrolysing)
MTKRKIAIFTGNRSEYGIISPIIKHIASDSRLEYYLIVSGTHLEKDFGETISNIKEDGFTIYNELKLKKVWQIYKITDNIDSFLIKENTTLKNAIEVIDKNQWEISFVTDLSGKLKGVATDGDIRRGLLSVLTLTSSISKIMNQNPLFIKSSWDGKKIDEVLNSDIAKSKTSLSGSIILPVVTEENKIVNIIHANRDSLYRSNNEIADIISNLSDILSELKPDFFLCHGDRYETFAAVICATQMIIPTVHIEGGDLTEGGALDDSIRHAITKLAHIHLTTNEDSYKRVIALGEEPWRVHNIGFPILDLIKEGNFADKTELEEKFGIDLNKTLVVFLQHSVTTEFNDSLIQIKQSLDAIEILAKQGITIIIIYPNNDAGSRAIIKKIRELESKNIPNIHVFKSLSRYFYHGLLNVCGNTGIGVCVGNSSSGIKETPAFNCPTVNIGSRQNRRLRAENVIDVGYNKEEIIDAANKCLCDEEFRKQCKNCQNPYDTRNSGKLVAEILATIPITSNLIKKKMTY